MGTQELESYLTKQSTHKVQKSLKIIYGNHIAGGISRGESVLTLGEFAEILRLSRETVVNLIKAGRIRAVRTGVSSGRWRISQSAVDDFLRGES